MQDASELTWRESVIAGGVRTRVSDRHDFQPPTLARPAFTHVGRDTLAALATSHLPALPRSHLLQRSAPTAGRPSYPSHTLAIAPAGNDVGGPHAIFPVHTVVLAAHCAALPPLPRPAHSSHASSAFAILHGFMYTHRLALLPLSPAFLASLERPSNSHSHSNSQDAAHAAIPSALTSGTTCLTLAAHLHSTSAGNLAAPMGHAGHVKAL
ncbi:hypothetical protein C8R44DRAFT_894125 [Mycena epipterygia]|nr:hypothetical protein C8R44DRAFT_894125 [Mycena epipterygia]